MHHKKCLNLLNYGYVCLNEKREYPKEKLGRLAGLEPATQGLGIPCSIRTELQAHSLMIYVHSNIAERLLYFNFSYEIATQARNDKKMNEKRGLSPFS